MNLERAEDWRGTGRLILRGREAYNQAENINLRLNMLMK